MTWSSMTIAGGLPLGAAVSVAISLLKKLFDISNATAKKIVVVVGLVYAIGAAISEGLATSGDPLTAIVNGIVSGASLIFGSEGFYQWVSKGKFSVTSKEES